MFCKDGFFCYKKTVELTQSLPVRNQTQILYWLLIEMILIKFLFAVKIMIY